MMLLNDERMTADITESELNAAISRLKPNKSPGSDGFPAEWYKDNPHHASHTETE